MKAGTPARLWALLLLVCPVLSQQGRAQPQRDYTGLLFYQLNTSHGLSDNYIYDMAIDSSGNLWIASGEGLNMYNGETVMRFFAREYPELRNDFGRQVICDGQNRIWVKTMEGYVAVIDEERNFHHVSLIRENTEIMVRRILYTASAGTILFTSEGHFQFPSDADLTEFDTLKLLHFSDLHVEGFDTLYQYGFHQVEHFDDSNYVFVLPDRFFKVNYFSGRVEKEYSIPWISVLAPWDDTSILTTDRRTFRLQVIDLRSGGISYPLDSLTDQFGKRITAHITNAERIGDDRYVMTTFKAGMYLYTTSTGQLTHHKHDISDVTTIANNHPLVITKDKYGWVFLGVTPHGVSYFKSDAVVGQQTVFKDESGYGFDGYINTIVTEDNDTYYIGTTDHLIKWRRSINATGFIEYDENSQDAPAGPGIYYLVLDPLKRMWISTLNNGVYVLDLQRKKIIRHFLNPPDGPRILLSNNMYHMQIGPDGWMWLTGNRGVCRVDPNTLEVDMFQGRPLEKLNGVNCARIWFADDDNLWIGTMTQGAWHYHIPSGSFTIYNTDNGMPSNEVLCFNADSYGNVYMGTAKGMQILLHDGRTRLIGMQEGLLNNRVEALLCDKQDRIWIGNDVALACFNIADTSLRIFDERYGLSVYGFRVSAYHQNPDDELIWGTERGIQYFYPDKLYAQTIRLPVTINRVETRDLTRNLTESVALRLAPSNNSVTFHFTSIDYSKHLRTFYAYKLEGLDENWITVEDQNSVRYNRLPAGEYTFRVRASNNEKEWEDSGNTVTISIAKHPWNQAWFRLLAILLLAGILWRIGVYYRRKQQQKQEELETQVVINYFASRINSYRKTDDLLWDVAEHCISKLHFEDCVIYLLDEERQFLVQKAAYGPKAGKSTMAERVDFTIYQPLSIPIGKGIVGAVAQSGKAEMIADTILDRRYLVDDLRRHSELAVPMTVDNKVIGVIDSEHSRKHFFTNKHMNILSTIATLCANQIQRVRAEEEKQQAMIDILKNQQKVTESRLQSLRLQMNPHFLFNALNSIQQMILANEEMVATRYLSRFSKLLRMILVHSDKEMVTLKEELEILKLYVDLEAVRFKDAFRYDISCDEDIDVDEVKIPTLLIQPFVENAIWHGLMHKEGDRLLTVWFDEMDDELHCVVEDNGIGREKAREMKLSTGQGQNHTSKGIAVSVERLKSMNGSNGHSGSMEIIDLKDDSGFACGTRVEITMPLQN